jgi:hypothetical protein
MHGISEFLYFREHISVFVTIKNSDPRKMPRLYDPGLVISVTDQNAFNFGSVVDDQPSWIDGQTFISNRFELNYLVGPLFRAI